MSGPDEEPTVEELNAVIRDAVGSVNEALLNVFRILGPPPGVPANDEPEE